jgi:hypothetical protein
MYDYTMYLRYNGKVHYQRFTDRQYGGAEFAKITLKKYRDGLMNGLEFKRIVNKKKTGKDSDLLTGVIEIKEVNNKKGRLILV